MTIELYLSVNILYKYKEGGKKNSIYITLAKSFVIKTTTMYTNNA